MTRKLFFLLAIATTAFAADLTTRDGTTYHNVEVTSVDRDRIHVMHSKGVAKLPFEQLPEALQKQYHYDAAKVAAFRKQQEDSKKATAAQAAAAEQERERQIQEAQAAERRRAEEAHRREQERIAADQRAQRMKEIGQAILLVVILFVGVVFYFVPSIVGRRKTNATAIFILNLFLGWTFLGWVLALVWACTKDSAMDTLARQRMATRGDTRYLE